MAWMGAKFLYVGAMLSGLVAAQVPLDQEPRHHLEFANEWLRVISPQIPPGDTTLEHLHTHDDATVCIRGSEVRAKQPGAEWSNAGAACAPVEPASPNIPECLARILCKTSARVCTTWCWWRTFGKAGGRIASLSWPRA